MASLSGELRTGNRPWLRRESHRMQVSWEATKLFWGCAPEWIRQSRYSLRPRQSVWILNEIHEYFNWTQMKPRLALRTDYQLAVVGRLDVVEFMMFQPGSLWTIEHQTQIGPMQTDYQQHFFTGVFDNLDGNSEPLSRKSIRLFEKDSGKVWLTIKTPDTTGEWNSTTGIWKIDDFYT